MLHRGVRFDGLGGVNTPQSDTRVVARAVGYSYVEGVAVDDADDAEGAAVVLGTIIDGSSAEQPGAVGEDDRGDDGSRNGKASGEAESTAQASLSACECGRGTNHWVCAAV